MNLHNFVTRGAGVIGMYVSLGKMFPIHPSMGMHVSLHTYADILFIRLITTGSFKWCIVISV